MSDDRPARHAAAEPPSAAGAAARWDDAALVAAVRTVDPAAFFVVPRVLRRVIKEHRRLPGFGVRVPHRKSYAIDAASLLKIVERDELGLRPGEPVPDTVILLPHPNPEAFQEHSPGELLIDYWQLLFHARVHVAMDARRRERAAEQAVDGRAGDAVARLEARRRIERIGAAQFDEIRDVLRSEDWLLAPGDPAQEYVETAAVFLQLRYFAPSLLPRYFPSLDAAGADALAALFAEEFDHAGLFAATRPVGAPDPEDTAEPASLRGWTEMYEPEEPDGPEDAPDGTPQRSERRFRRLMDHADRACALGNVVRAAMLRVQAEAWAPRRSLSRCRAAMREDLNRLERRLTEVLELPGEGAQLWHETLAVLARQGARGVWTVEGRLLYDLQKICLDGKRERFAVDLVEWCLSLGRRPIKRPLPAQRDVVIAGHLARALRRLAGARLLPKQRHELDEMLWDASARVERRIRQTLGPRIEAALEEVGLSPHNAPEGVARSKLVEELLDRIVRRGFLTMSDVRDAVSRNQLKLGDLGAGRRAPAAPAPEKPPAWPGRLRAAVSAFARRVLPATAEFFRGDALLGVNRRLAVSLDGVYHRGEFYLRWMQRMIGVAFGTAAGRLLTQWIALPFVGAFVVLFALDDLIELATRREVAVFSPTSMVLLGVFLVAIINSPRFRRFTWRALKGMGRAIRWTLVDLPRAALELPWVRRILASRWFRWSWRYGIKPVAFSAVVWAILPQSRASAGMAAFNAAAVFMLVNLVINSRVGRMTEEVLLDWSLQAWHRFGVRFLVGLFTWIVDFFRGMLRLVERFMYAVDEWLRFRTGESRLTFWTKALLGSVWFFLTYVTRFCITLLIEPQINPIKHFPVVTVSHKVLFWFIKPLGDLMLEQAPRLGVELVATEAYGMATLFIWCIPGVFGFLAWELMASWRLFAANRPETLRPALVGDHGETMGRLLRRGFHSGTLPKRFQKLRRAERKARRHGSWRAVRKHLQTLHHAETDLEHFFKRDLLAPLAQRDPWFQCVHVADVRLGPVGIVARLGCKGPVPEAVYRAVVASEPGDKALGYETPDYDRPYFDPAPGIDSEPVMLIGEALRRHNVDRWWEQEGFGRLSLRSREGWITADFAPGPAALSLGEPLRTFLANAVTGFYQAVGVDLLQQQLTAAFPDDVGIEPAERGLVVWSRRRAGAEAIYDLRAEDNRLSPQPAGVVADLPAALPRSAILFGERKVLWIDWIAAWTPPCDGSSPGDRIVASGGAIAPRRLLPDVPVLGPAKAESPPA